MTRKAISAIALLLLTVLCVCLASCGSAPPDTEFPTEEGNDTLPEETSGSADAETEPGSGTVPGEEDTTDYSGLRVELSSYGGIYALEPYEIEVYDSDDWWVSGEELTFELVDNTAEAVIESAPYGESKRIRAQKEGSATVIVSHAEHGYGKRTFEFLSPGPVFEESDATFYVGDRCHPNIDMLVYLTDIEGYFADVLEGDAGIFTDEDGNTYIQATKAGEVSFLLTCKCEYGDVTNVQTLTFVDHDFTVGMSVQGAYVGHEIPLQSSCSTIWDFESENVVYTVEGEEATVSGNLLKVMKPGTVTVHATYLYNGVTLTASAQIAVDYDENTITSVSDLEKLRNSDQIFHLLGDLDLSSAGNWDPIDGFSGILYGNGHTVTGLTLRPTQHAEPAGLFGKLLGTVKNLTIDGTLSCMGEIPYMGLLCGINAGEVEDVTASGSVEAPYSDAVGGIIGLSENIHIKNCTASVTVRGRQGVGGIAGAVRCRRAEDAMLEGLKNHGEIIGASSVGGVFGGLAALEPEDYQEGTYLITLATPSNDAAVSGTGDNVGGVIGYLSGLYIDNWNDVSILFKLSGASNTGAVSGLNCVGGILGYAPEHVSELILCTNTADVSGEMYVGGFAGRAEGTVLKDLTNNVSVIGKAYVGGIAGSAGGLEGCTNNGTLSIVSYYIDNAENTRLSYVGGIAGSANYVLDCTNNSALDVSSGGRYVGGIVGYLSVPRDTAAISGNANHGEIKGVDYVGGIVGALVIAVEEKECTVIFTSNRNDAPVSGTKNCVGGILGYAAGSLYEGWDDYAAYLKIASCTNEESVSGKDYVGGILGYSPEYVAEISICSSTASVSGETYVGGIAGCAYDTAMRDMENGETVTGRAYVGGIAGLAGLLERCTNRGAVINVGYIVDDNSNKISCLGGIAGCATDALNCTNEKDIDASSGGMFVGGIAGLLVKSRTVSIKAEGNKNHGEIKGDSSVGGIFGAVTVAEGKNNDVIVLDGNTNDGSITATGDVAGGIVGYAMGNACNIDYGDYLSVVKFMNCTNESAVTGRDYVGGIVGHAEAHVSEILLCKNLDDVTGRLYVGGFAGRAEGTAMTSLKNSYTVTGKAYVGGIAGYAGKLSECENNGAILLDGCHLDETTNEAVSYVGGIAGYATGAVSCTNNKGIDASLGGRYVGGIVGYLSKSRTAGEKVEENTNHGEIKGTDYVGGIAGYLTVQKGKNDDVIFVSDNKNDGAVSASGEHVGGILGYVEGNACEISYDDYLSTVKIVNCTNEADVSGKDCVGGLVGTLGECVETSEAVWNTNRPLGDVSATGVNVGDHYGFLHLSEESEEN